MLDIVIESPSTKRVVRARAHHFDPDTFVRLLLEIQVGGLESAAHYLNATGTWARVVNFHDDNHGVFTL